VVLPSVPLPTILVLALLSPASGVNGQQQGADLEKKFGRGAFQTLSGNHSLVRYSAGSLDRAHHLLNRLEALSWQFDRWSDDPGLLGVYLLRPDEWRELAPPDLYGLPMRLTPTVMLAPAVGTESSVRLWRGWLGADGLPTLPGTPLVGEHDEVASLMVADVFLQLEASRGFVRSAGIVGETVWMTDLLAHVVALEVFHEFEKARLDDLDRLFDRLDTRLADAAVPLDQYRPWVYGADDMQIERWLWFQAQLERGARPILQREGRGAIKRIEKLRRRDGGVLRWQTLVDRYPHLAQWRSDLEARSAGGP
jgi:hypothetical protein